MRTIEMAGKHLKQNFNEIFSRLRKARGYQEKINILKEGESAALHTFIFMALHPEIVINVPKGPIPMDIIGKADPKPEDLQQANLFKIFSRKDEKGIPAVVKYSEKLSKIYKQFGGFTPAKRESFFIEEIKYLSEGERNIFVEFKDKTLRGITIEIYKKAFPDTKLDLPLWQYFKSPSEEEFNKTFNI